jgi:hypothetical protein
MLGGAWRWPQLLLPQCGGVLKTSSRRAAQADSLGPERRAVANRGTEQPQSL